MPSAPRSLAHPSSLLAVAACLLALAACGDDPGDRPAATAPTTAAERPSAATSPPLTATVPPATPEPAPAPAPEPPPAAAPARPPTGPPRIPFRRGDGPQVGALARSAYHARAFFPVPETFRRGGIPAGSRAGGCRVPRPSRTDRRQLERVARSRHPRDTVQGIFDEGVLLARCGRLGDHGLVVWVHRSPERDRAVDLVEVVRRDGRWQQRRGRLAPGCGVPRAAASAWRIDVSACPRGRAGRRP